MTCPAVLIEDAVCAALLAAGIGMTTESIRPRDQPLVLKDDPNPLCVVVVGDDQFDGAYQTNVGVYLAYPVLVVWAKKKAQTVRRADAERKEARWAIFGALYRSLLLGADGAVRDCDYEPNPEFSTEGWPQDYRYSGQRFLYQVSLRRPELGPEA